MSIDGEDTSDAAADAVARGPKVVHPTTGSLRSRPGRAFASLLRSWRWLVPAVLLGGGLLWAALAYREFMAVPRERLAPGEHYAEMPPDSRHHYLDLPLDHRDPASPEFRGFYLLSPGFSPEGPVVFFLTDGQMELVGLDPDFAWFDQYLGGVSYVLIGHRGHAPTLFPEAFTADDALDLAAAMRLYGSWQVVEDIERVRQDLGAKGLLPSDGKISLFGASGAGILAQQFVHRYGQHVQRVVLQATGAPDLARARGWPYSPSFAAFDPEGAAVFHRALAVDEDLDEPSAAYLLFQEGRKATEPHQEQRALVDELAAGYRAFQYGLVGPSRNLRVIELMMRSPTAAAAKIRMYELLGSDLVDHRRRRDDVHLLYDWTMDVLGELIEAERRGALERPDLVLERSAFEGEVLVLAADEDVVFSVAIAEAIRDAYSHARLGVLHGGHSVQAHPELQLALRVEFLRGGFESAAVERLLRDPRLVRVPSRTPAEPARP